MLQLKNICKKYVTGTLVQTALDDVSLNLRDNEFVAILGPSGSGKTSLLNIIGGLDHYDTGDLIINGTSTKEYTDRDWDTYRNHTIGFVFQSYNLIPHQTILANVELALTISGISRGERRKRATEALEQVGLGDQLHKKPNQLSGGQMQRVAIARALVNNPDILLADEPTGALDTQTGIQVMELLKEVAKDRLVVMVTHNPELAEQYATRIVRLTDGKLISDTDPFEVKDGKAEKGSYAKKASMSILTAFGLSANNLRTKKARTILTAFAGSIGIIGIGLILALSLGVNDYIKSIEQDTLSEYPLTISSSGFDFTSMLTSTMGSVSGDEDDSGSGDIHVFSMVTSMFSSVNSNDLTALKTYLESGESDIWEYARAIEYTYDVEPQIYRVVDEDTVRQVNPDSTFSSLGFGSSASSSSLISSMMSTNVFYSLPQDEDLYINQYDVVAGHWPENYNECVLVLSSGSYLSDFLLYTLGLRDAVELDEMIESFVNGENVDEIDEIGEYSYDDILGIAYKLVIAADYYEYDETYGVWTDKSGDAAYLYDLVTNGDDLTIVGIVQPSEDATASSLSSGIYYPYTLTNYITTEAASRQIVQEQLADSSLNVLTGESFGITSDMDLGSDSLFSIDTDVLSDLFSLDSDSFEDLFSDMDFSDLDLSGLDFSDFDFSSLDLSAYDFSDIDLSGYDFSNIDLSSYDFSSLDLSSLDLSALDLSSLDLSGMDLSGLDLSDMDLSGLDLSSVDLSGLDLSSMDFSDIDLSESLDFSDMDFSELLDLSSIDFAEILADADLPEFDFNSILENVSVDISADSLSAVFDSLLAGYEDYLAEHPEEDMSKIADCILEYLESDEAAAILSEFMADILIDNGDITLSAEALEALFSEIFTGYQTYVEEMGYAEDDVDSFGTYLAEYFQTEDANEIVTAWAEEYLTFDTDISLSSDQLTALLNDLMAGYETYAEEHDYPVLSDLTDSFLNYLSSDEAQEIVMDAVLSMVDLDALEAEITELMEDYMQAYMEAVMDAVAAELETQLAEVLETQLSAAISTAISEALQTQITEALEAQLAEALQTQIADALEAQLTEALQTQLSEAISAELSSALESQLSTVLASAMEDIMSEMMETIISDVMSEVMSEMMNGVMSDAMSDVMSEMMEDVMEELTAQLGTQLSDTIATVMEDMMSELTEEMQTSLTDALSIDTESFAEAFSLNMDAEELYALLTSMSSSSTTAANNLTSFGYADLDSPSEIDIYSKDFESKGYVTDILDAYNANLEAEGKEDQVITYTDLVGTMMSSVTDIVNIVTYVLIAFVSLSLVVSCIMIAIITHISVLERTKEIGILRAIGASKRNISEVFNAETFIIGLCSGLIGVGVSEILIIPINRLIQSLAGSDIVKASLPANYATMLVLVSLFITIIGGLLPARSAAKKDPVIALRTE